jgi:DNA-binding response OmpR family regulator
LAVQVEIGGDLRLKILLVEDEPATRDALAAVLKDAHYSVNIAADGQLGLDLALACEPDLVLLDVGLPKLNGLHLCEQLRSAGYANPILLLTAKNSSDDRVLGLDAGADDYVTKPFDIPELLARVRALIRRSKAVTSSVVVWENLTFDVIHAKVTVGDRQIHLTPKEYCLLELFLFNPKRIFSRSVILDKLWDFAESPGELAVSTHIKCVRQKLKAAGVTDPVETVYGLGYRLRSEKMSNLDTNPTPGVVASPPQSPTLPQEQIQQRTAQTWRKYQHHLSEQVAYLEQVVQGLQQSVDTPEQRQQAEQIAHKLAGSLGIFGLTLGSQLARRLEELFPTLSASDTTQIQQIAGLVGELRQQLDQAIVESKQEFSTAGLATAPASPLILIVDDDLVLAERVRVEAIAWGLRVEVATDLPIARQLMDKTLPNLILLDLNFPGGQAEGLELLQELKHTAPTLPVLVFTSQNQLSTRLQTLRLGARAFLHKPLPSYAIMQAVLQHLYPPQTSQEPQICLIDVDATLGNCLAELLAPQGIQVMTLTQPDQLWQMITTSAPGLLVINQQLPGIDALELCQVVREDLQWQHIQIIVLTPASVRELSIDQDQLIDQAFAAGADDCLSRDLPLPELVTRMRRRLQRGGSQPKLALLPS